MRSKDNLAQHFRLKPAQIKALAKLGLHNIISLLYHFPSRYVGEKDVLLAKITSQGIRKSWRKRVPIAEMTLQDIAGKKIKAIWFSQAYMAKKFTEGSLVRLSGKSKEYRGTLSFTNPIIELASELEANGPLFQLPVNRRLLGNLVPVYPESHGVSSLWLTHAIQKILKSGILKQLEDPIPKEILQKYKLPSLAHSLIYIHTPKRESDARVARKRFSFQEIFFIQLERQRQKREYGQKSAYNINGKISAKEFTKRMKFTPTKAQTQALDSIIRDMNRAQPMMRLLEGDVGSGKTFVAAAAAYAVIENGFHVAYMAPTEILAKQHFESFIEFYKHLPNIKIGLLTGSECRKFPSKISHPSTSLKAGTHISRALMLKRIATGQM